MARINEGDPAQRGPKREREGVRIPEIPIGKELDLTGRVAIITGGSRGFGRAMADIFSGHGAHIVIVSTERSEGEAKETLALVESHGASGLWVPGDVSQPETASNVVKAAVKEFGHVDILVNNAGIRRDQAAIMMKEGDWTQVIDTNLSGPFYFAKAAMRQMIRQKTLGSIVNITSVAGQIGSPGQANYVAAKAGVIGLTMTLALEGAPFGIRVNAIAPGLSPTELTSDLTPEQRSVFVNMTPIQREVDPYEVARGGLFLVSDMSSAITGQVINVDGGMVRG